MPLSPGRFCFGVVHLIGEKIGFIGVKPLSLPNGTRSRYLFDVTDAMRKLDKNQSYSQMVIAWASMKGIRPYELNMDSMKWLGDGFERENRALAAAGMATVRIGDLVPDTGA